MHKKVIVTGAAGFIGFHTCKKLLQENYKVIGIDNISNYYDVKLKYSRLKELDTFVNSNKKEWEFIKASLEEFSTIEEVFKKFNPDIVINLAAQAGVRYSIDNPRSYINSNILGFFNILECCKNFAVKNFIFASSSSVCGGNKNFPFKETDLVDHPVSLYAATKKSNEILAHSYSHLYRIPSTGLRFFTVYGPWGRPDMAPMIFADAIINKKSIKVFNYGNMKRDFTYIDDIVESIFRCCKKPATSDPKFHESNPNPSSSSSPFRILNLGNNEPIDLLKFIKVLEEKFGLNANKEFLPMQKGDVQQTAASNILIKEWIDYTPQTSLKTGINNFVEWYLNYYDL